MKGIKFKRTTADKQSQQVDTEQKNKLNPNTMNESTSEKTGFKKLLAVLSPLRNNNKHVTKQHQDSQTLTSKEETALFTRLAAALHINKSLGLKISVIFIISLIVCVAVVGFSSAMLSKSNLEENIISASEETIKQVARNIDTTLANYDDITFQLMFDDKVVSNMSNYIAAEDMLAQIDATRALNDLLSTYIFSNTQLKNIAIIPAYGQADAIVSGTIQNNMTKRLSTDEYQAQPWFQDVIDKNGGVVWISPQSNGILQTGLNDTVALARIVTNTTRGHEYLLMLEFSTQDLFAATNDVEIIENSYIEVIDKSNTYIKSNVSEQVGLEANYEFVTLVGDRDQGQFHIEHKSTQEPLIVVYSKIEENESWYLAGVLSENEIQKEINPIMRFTMIVIVLAAGLAVVIGFFMLRMISRPLTQISTVMIKGAEGDLTVRAPIMNRKDEIGVLARTFDEMMIQIEGLARQTTTSAQHVLTTAAELSQASHKTAIAGKEISIATDEIAAGASALAVEAEKGSDLTNNINNQMIHVNQSREQMNYATNLVDEASEKGLDYMNGLISRTGETEQMVNAMVGKVDALSESTKSIVKILDVLNSITKQTNILSLNATIEAARAGQAGKGFMVVADEIRQLAEQSRRSIDVVGQITATISKEIGETVGVLKQAQPIFQEQIVSVKEANQLFVSVRSQMEMLKDNINGVSAAFDQLSDSQETLSQSMNNVSAVAEQSSATSQEVASLSSEQLMISEQLVNLSAQLESVSENLKNQLSRFKIS